MVKVVAVAVGVATMICGDGRVEQRHRRTHNAKAVETQGKGSVSRTKAVETQGKGSVLSSAHRARP